MDDEDSTSRQQDERPEDGGNYEDGVDDDVDVAFAKDTKLEQYLNTLDEYTTIRNDANEQLIKAFITLSKANLALWPHMISKDSIDLRPCKAQTTIDIEINENGQSRFVVVKDRKDPQDADAESGEGILLDHARKQDNNNNNNNNPSVSLRRRPQKNQATIVEDKEKYNGDDSVDEREKEKDVETPKLAKDTEDDREDEKDVDQDENKKIAVNNTNDPIYRFSSFPPPALKHAQKLFNNAAVRLIECQNVVSSLKEQEELLNSDSA